MGKRVLVCGAGSIGRRHIANLLQLGAEVTVWRSRTELLAEIERDFQVHTCNDLMKGIDAAEAVVVATATDEHVSIALATLEAGRALFIEKPLSNNWTGIDKLSFHAKGKVVEVGFQFRAHPNIISLANQLKEPSHQKLLTYRLAMGHRLDLWRPNQNYERGYSANSDRGGGALFDLIHQIDIALWLFGPVVGVNAVLSKVSELKINGDDVSNLLLTHQNGVTGHIQLDMASPIYRCEAEVMSTSAIFRWTNAEGLLRKISTEGEEIIDRLPDEFKRNDMFYTQMKHWLNRIDNSKLLPLCSYEDGLAALRVALCAREASSLKKMVHI